MDASTFILLPYALPSTLSTLEFKEGLQSEESVDTSNKKLARSVYSYVRMLIDLFQRTEGPHRIQWVSLNERFCIVQLKPLHPHAKMLSRGGPGWIQPILSDLAPLGFASPEILHYIAHLAKKCAPQLSLTQDPLESPKRFKSRLARNTWGYVCELARRLIRYQGVHLMKLTFVSEKRWLVKLDPMHRNGKILREIWWPKWMQSTPEDNEVRKHLYGFNFFDWLNRQPQAQTIPTVQYLSDTELKNYELRLENGKLVTTKEPIPHTLDVNKPHLYVVSAVFKRYIAPHAEGFQHLSLCQDCVAEAGEIVLRKGRPKIVTDGSGHFLCGAAALCEMVNWLHHKMGFNMRNVAVITACAEEPWQGVRHTRGKRILVSKVCYELFCKILSTSNSLKDKTFFDWIHIYSSLARNPPIKNSLLKFISTENAAAKRVQKACIQQVALLEKEWEERHSKKKTDLAVHG